MSVLLCLWDVYHQGSESRYGLTVCAECERPLVHIEIPGAPAALWNGQPVQLPKGYREGEQEAGE